MPKYIDAEALVEKFKDPLLFNVTPRHLQIIMETPTADVEPVRHGRWIDGNCSVCAVPAVTLRQADGVELRVETPRCPNCGARMDGESEERK